MELSLIIPAFNEEDRLGSNLGRVLDYLRGRNETFEVIVADDGSSDGTSRVAAESGDSRVRVLRLERNRGKGAAVREGMLAARGEFRVFTDADLSTPIEELDQMLAELRAGADLCIGNRALISGQVKVRQGWLRAGLGWIFKRLVGAAGVSGISDTQCGFKGLRAAAAEALLPRMTVDGFCFDVELLLLADRAGLRVVQIPVNWSNHPQSRLRTFRDSARMLGELWIIRRRYRKGRVRGSDSD